MSSVPFFFYALSHFTVLCINVRSVLKSGGEKDASYNNCWRLINAFFCFFLICNNFDSFGGGEYFSKPSVSSGNLFYILAFIHLVLLPLYIPIFAEYALRAYELLPERLPEQLALFTSRKKWFRLVYAVLALALTIIGAVQYAKTITYKPVLETMGGVRIYSSGAPPDDPIGVIVIALSGIISGIAIRYKTSSKYKTLWVLQVIETIGQGFAVSADQYLQLVSNLFECMFTWSVVLCDLHLTGLEGEKRDEKVNNINVKLARNSVVNRISQQSEVTNPVNSTV